jgi:hypothetical protein
MVGSEPTSQGFQYYTDVVKALTAAGEKTEYQELSEDYRFFIQVSW